MPVTAADLRAAAARYARSLPDRFDVVHLGVGDDGHTASWPPGDHDVLRQRSARRGRAAVQRPAADDADATRGQRRPGAAGARHRRRQAARDRRVGCGGDRSTARSTTVRRTDTHGRSWTRRRGSSPRRRFRRHDVAVPVAPSVRRCRLPAGSPTCSPPTPSVPAVRRRRPATCASTTRSTRSTRPLMTALLDWADAARVDRAPRRDVRAASRSTSPRIGPVLHVALRAPGRRGDRGRRPQRRARRARRARRDGGVRRSRPRRRPHHRRRQHRHRRLRPRAGDGGASARRLRPSAPARPLRVERRRRRHPRHAAGARPGGDAVHRRLQDVRHDRDAHQRPHRAALAGRRARRGRRPRPLRRRVDQRRTGGRVRDRHRQHVRVLGLGRRALLGRLGDRAVADDLHRPRAVPRVPGRLPRRRRALRVGAAGEQRPDRARA